MSKYISFLSTTRFHLLEQGILYNTVHQLRLLFRVLGIRNVVLVALAEVLMILHSQHPDVALDETSPNSDSVWIQMFVI